MTRQTMLVSMYENLLARRRDRDHQLMEELAQLRSVDAMDGGTES